MQTGLTASALITAAHTSPRQLVITAEMLVVEDPRIRGWSATASGTLAMLAAPSASGSGLTTGSTSGQLTSGVRYGYAVTTNSGTTQSTASNIIELTAKSWSGSNQIAWSGVAAMTSYSVYRTSASAGNSAQLLWLPSSLITTQTATSFRDTAN
jgi:hypothetical protein